MILTTNRSKRFGGNLQILVFDPMYFYLALTQSKFIFDSLVFCVLKTLVYF